MIVPTIHFQGGCDEAISFYKEALNAEVKVINYAKNAPPNSGMEGLPPNFVMHSEIQMFGGTVSMTDGAETSAKNENFNFTLFIDTAEEVTSLFNKLSDGGKIIEPLAPQFWTPLWGYVTDRFGVNWSICVVENSK